MRGMALTFIDPTLERMSRTQIVGLSVAGVAAVGVLDEITGYELSLSLLYLLPVALAAWYVGRGAGVAVAALAGLVWLAAGWSAGRRFSTGELAAWNTLVRFGFFVVTGLLLSALRASQDELRRLARTDALTGLWGRQGFEDRLAHDLALSLRHSTPLTIVYIDVDDFKLINDEFGHAAGDDVLRRIAQVLRVSLRQADSAARLGGDEFALVLPETDPDGARQLIGKLAGELEAAMNGGAQGVSCSIGVVTLRQPGISTLAVVAAADAVMYRVKRSGKARVVYSVEDSPASITRREACGT
jgi:diguanylate cyclase (GGDEF)-like protein